MKKTVLAFGLLSGIIIIVYSLIVFMAFGSFSSMSTSDFAKVEMLGYLRYIILLLTVIFALRYFKKQNIGVASFKQLWLAGIYTSLMVALLVGLMEIVYMLVYPQFMEQYAEMTTRKMVESGATSDMVAAHKKEMEQYKWMANPVFMGIFYFFETAVLGTIMSLVVALITKSPKPKPAIA